MELVLPGSLFLLSRSYPMAPTRDPHFAIPICIWPVGGRSAGSASGMRHQSRALIALIVLLLARIIVITDGIISNATFTDKAARAIGKGKTDTDSLLVILICPLKRRCFLLKKPFLRNRKADFAANE